VFELNLKHLSLAEVALPTRQNYPCNINNTGAITSHRDLLALLYCALIDSIESVMAKFVSVIMIS